jgi:hypothetical protein
MAHAATLRTLAEGLVACRWAYGYYVLLVIPIFPFMISCLLAAVASLWSRRGWPGHVWGFQLGFMCETGKQVRMYFLSCIGASLPFLGVIYNNVCLQAFSCFACSRLRDGALVLTVAPSVTCFTPEHSFMMGISVVAILVYVIGLPALTLFSTLYLYRNDEMRNPEWLVSLGLFYRDYGVLTAPFHAACYRIAAKPFI